MPPPAANEEHTMTRIKTLLVLGSLCLGLCANAQPPAAAPQAAPAGLVPRTTDGKPDMNGYWNPQIQGVLNNIDNNPAGAPPYTPAARARVEEIRTNRMADEPELHCFMSGITHQVYVQFGFQLVQSEDWLHWLSEFMGSTRHIATDGRAHIHPNIELFNGDSVAHWEGDTLVIDTTNQNGRTWLDINGAFTTANLHVVERLTMMDANTIRWEATLTDPTIYTAPWTLSGNLVRNTQPGYEQMEFACIEGNRDLEHYLESDGGTAQPGF
jgi:hypothetical protein